MTPIVAEEFASSINWTLIFTGLMAVATALMWWDARKARSVNISGSVSGAPPDNSILARDVKSLSHRMKSLEEWRQQLVNKMDGDKNTIIESGEERARRIYAHVEEVRRELDEKITRVPNETVALLKNTGAI